MMSQRCTNQYGYILGPDDKLFKQFKDEFDNLDSTRNTFWEWPEDDVRKKLGKKPLTGYLLRWTKNGLEKTTEN